ncbi:MAG: hypothetical protein IPF79_02335 [Ignavibacteria bacterium]|nr:hypothetical protein [Ignavibacteria bacterium]
MAILHESRLGTHSIDHRNKGSVLTSAAFNSRGDVRGVGSVSVESSLKSSSSVPNHPEVRREQIRTLDHQCLTDLCMDSTLNKLVQSARAISPSGEKRRNDRPR